MWVFCDEEGDVPLVESGANALIAFKCYIENNRWAGFLDWRVCGAAVCPKNGMHPFVTDEPPQQSRVFSTVPWYWDAAPLSEVAFASG